MCGGAERGWGPHGRHKKHIHQGMPERALTCCGPVRQEDVVEGKGFPGFISALEDGGGRGSHLSTLPTGHTPRVQEECVWIRTEQPRIQVCWSGLSRETTRLWIKNWLMGRSRQVLTPQGRPAGWGTKEEQHF